MVNDMKPKIENSLEKAKQIAKHLEKSDFPSNVKQQITLGVAFGVKNDTIIKGAVSTLSAMETTKAERETPQPSTPIDYTPIERVIANMLQESTRTNILDSGGAYGRHWQKNRAIDDFRKLNACQTEIHAPHYYKDFKGKRRKMDGEILIYYNVFAYLTNFLEIDDDAKMLNEAFDEFAERDENKRAGWFALMQQFAEDEIEKYGFTNGGTVNTYNYENLLSQVLQFVWLHKNGDEYDTYIMLQIHNGADVRGGYTKPKIFRVLDRDYFIIAQNDVNVRCECRYCNAYSDDGAYNWQMNDAEYWETQKTLDDKTPNIPLTKRIKWLKDKNGKYGADEALCKKCGKPLEFAVMETF